MSPHVLKVGSRSSKESVASSAADGPASARLRETLQRLSGRLQDFTASRSLSLSHSGGLAGIWLRPRNPALLSAPIVMRGSLSHKTPPPTPPPHHPPPPTTPPRPPTPHPPPKPPPPPNPPPPPPLHPPHPPPPNPPSHTPPPPLPHPTSLKLRRIHREIRAPIVRNSRPIPWRTQATAMSQVLQALGTSMR